LSNQGEEALSFGRGGGQARYTCMCNPYEHRSFADPMRNLREYTSA
jgi:hypothetical protein